MRLFTMTKPVLACACAAVLAGCTWLQDWEGPQAKALPPQPPQAKLVQTADATWIDPAPVQPPVERYVPAPSETALQMGRRLDRMEQQIEDMHNDMQTMMPALSRLSAVEEAVQADSMQPASGPVVAAPLPEAMGDAPAMPARIVPVPAASAAPAALVPAAQKASYAPPLGKATDIHFSEDIQKTRIVVDVSGDMAFTYDVDKDGKILSIIIPGATWSGPSGGPVEGSKLISAYQAAPDGKGGTSLTLKLNQPAKVLWAQTLPGVGDKTPRIVIDLGAS